MSIFKEIISAGKLTTYEIGLLQTKAFRTLKERTDGVLLPFEITSTEWAFLGMLHEYKDGIRSSDIADCLGVEAPFVTVLVANFMKRKWVTQSKDKTDMRAKLIFLTSEGHKKVIDIEAIVRKVSKTWLKDVSIKDVLAYIRVLKKLSSPIE